MSIERESQTARSRRSDLLVMIEEYDIVYVQINTLTKKPTGCKRSNTNGNDPLICPPGSNREENTNTN